MAEPWRVMAVQTVPAMLCHGCTSPSTISGSMGQRGSGWRSRRKGGVTTPALVSALCRFLAFPEQLGSVCLNPRHVVHMTAHNAPGQADCSLLCLPPALPLPSKVGLRRLLRLAVTLPLVHHGRARQRAAGKE